MDSRIIFLFFLFAAIRIGTVFVSRRNERRLRMAGAQEFSAHNSKRMAFLHYAFFGGAYLEGEIRQAPFDGLALIGTGLLVFSAAVIVTVIRQLSPYWTVKVIIAPEHVIKDNWLIRLVRHPNYYLNIIPELTGLMWLMKSYWTALMIFPLYAVCLAVRIRDEEQALSFHHARDEMD